jgi:phosphoglycolate phosphatase
MIPPFPVYVFDVDGTLLDSAGDICGAMQTALQSVLRTDVSEALLRRYIGRHLKDLFVDLGYDQGAIEPLIAVYREAYRAREHGMTSVFPGVADALGRLGGRKSTATTKGTPTTKTVLERFGLIGHFDHVQGTDGFPAKPEPDVLRKTLEALCVTPDQCLFVGDSSADMEAGRRAGMPTCAVRYGYGDQAEMKRWQPDFWVDDLGELVPAG